MPIELPTLLDPALEHYKEAVDDTALLRLLRESSDLAAFLTAAIDDDVWTGGHRPLVAKLIEVVTRRYFRDSLSQKEAVAIARVIRDHYDNLTGSLVHDLTLRVGEERYPINSLLFTVDSSYIRGLVLKECSERNLKELRWRDGAVSPSFLQGYLDFCNTGEFPNLRHCGRKELEAIMVTAIHCQCSVLEEEAAKGYRRYLESDTVFQLLASCYSNYWHALAVVCCEYIEELYLGIRCWVCDQGLAVEISDSHDATLEAVQILQDQVSFLSCHNDFVDSPHFKNFLLQMGRLQGVDLSSTENFSENFDALPCQLRELNLSRCPWLDGELLDRLFTRCQQLHTLRLADNTQLTQRSWRSLCQPVLEGLETLDIGGCSQIDDADFKVLILGAKGVSSLILNGCSKITDRTFFELPRFCRGLRCLEASRCQIADMGLGEIVARCPIEKLNLENCLNLTERGLVDAVRHATYLSYIDVTGCQVDGEKLHTLLRSSSSL